MTKEASPKAEYRDLRGHIRALEAAGLVHRIDREINKDTEMHPLVRWQYRGGIPDSGRKAFLFTNVTDSKGRKYDYPCLVGGLAGSRQIYATALGCTIDEIGDKWEHALNNPIDPIVVEGNAPVQEVVHQGAELEAWGGLMNFPQPISTPGYDNAPYLTSAQYITKDPDTGVRNVGHYRGQIKGATRVAVQFSTPFKDALIHWNKAKAKGEHLPVAIVIGGSPVIAYGGVQRVSIGTDEYGLAGALAGEPIRLVKCKTVDIEVPADAEVIIEGIIRTDYLEPEGPFGESYGFVCPRTESPMVEITCITHRRDPIWTSFISQVTPSESSTIKIVAYEPMFLNFLRNTCGVKSLVRVVMHEPLSNIRPVIFLQFKKPSEGEVWRALKLCSSYQTNVGKVVIAVDEDIDPDNLDAIMWSFAYRMTPHKDVQIVRGFYEAFGDREDMDNSCLLINATLREKLPPISLPKKEFMEHSLKLWRELGLPQVTPQAPWHGYSLGDWNEALDAEAQLAAESRWDETGELMRTQQKKV
jgi:4-hydroxy-3-polyprenylbenzoate decarboxylase